MPILEKHSEILFFSQVFLMVGEFPRAELIAKTFLTNCRYFKNILGLDFYCGKYKNFYISILIHKPKLGDVDLCTKLLFSHEFFNAKLIIKIGSCISVEKNIQKGQFHLVSKVFHKDYFYGEEDFLENIQVEYLDKKLQKNFLDKSNHLKINIQPSSFYTIDSFCQKSLLFKHSKKMAFDFLDLDSISLYKNAKFYKKQAISLSIVKDNNCFNLDKDIDDFKNLVFLALETSIRYV